MSSVRQLPGDFIPAPDDVLTDGMGRMWVPDDSRYWLNLTNPASVERLAAIVEVVCQRHNLWQRTSVDYITPPPHEIAAAIIERLREGVEG